MAGPSLKELEARGRELKRAGGAAGEALRAKQRIKIQRKLDRRARLSTSPFYNGVSLTLFLGVMLAGLGGAAFLNFDFFDLRSLPTIALLALCGLSPGALLYLIAWLQGGARLQAERRWVASLPFQLEGHLLHLGYFEERRVAPELYNSASLEIEFAGPAPTEDLNDACLGFDPELRVHPHKNTLGLRRPAMMARDNSNYRYYRWVHRLVDELLLPLHAQRPIERVALKSEDLGRLLDGPDWTELQ